MRIEPTIERAEELWQEGATFPEIAEALRVDREAIRLALESRRLYRWNSAPRSVPSCEHEWGRQREADLLIAEVEGFLAGEGKART